MELKFANDGPKSFKIKRDKIFYRKQIEEKDKALGYVKISDIKKRKVNTKGSNYLLSVLGRQLPLFEFCGNEKVLKKVCGYLRVITEEGETAFVALVSRRKYFNCLPLAVILLNLSSATGAVVAAGVIVTIAGTTLLVYKEYIEDPQPAPIVEERAKEYEPEESIPRENKPEGVLENKEEAPALAFSDKEEKYSGQVIVEQGKPAEELKNNEFFTWTYTDITLLKDEPLPLVNDPTNDVNIQYVIKVKGEIIFSIGVRPGGAIPWNPSIVLPIGTTTVELIKYSYSLDGSQNNVVSRNTFKITIIE